MNKLPTIIWPHSVSASPTILGRTGRVLHWGFALLAAAFLIGGAVSALSGDDAGIMGIGFGAVSVLIGRAIRYVLSAE